MAYNGITVGSGSSSEDFSSKPCDICQRGKIQEALRESEDRFRTAFENAAIGMAIVSLEGRFLKVNQSLSDIVGYTEEELLATDFQSITHYEDLSVDLEYIQKLLNSEIRFYHLEKRYLHKDGHVVWILLSVSLVRDYEGNPLYFIAQIQDITKRKLAEEELKKKNEELRAQKIKAIEAIRLKSQFLANMSHELRTPLNSILGFTTRVIKKGGELLPKVQLENLIIVREEGQHLLDLINNLLDYSKMEAGKMQVHPERFNLIKVVDEVNSIVHTLMDGKPLTYERKYYTNEDIYIMSDRIKVKQILINLLSNAIKYSDKGTVSLFIDKVGDKYCIKVQDEGIGIALEDLNSIFDEFRQLDGSYTRKAGGTGLGLSITKRFVEMLGGSIEVISASGIGSCFTVYLPIEYKNINNEDCSNI
ncbi:MAG: PAS domain S-box protein [Clostridia bacterium]|nr:PAS domain S-box protein [Clostridia bacterium]